MTERLEYKKKEVYRDKLSNVEINFKTYTILGKVIENPKIVFRIKESGKEEEIAIYV